MTTHLRLAIILLALAMLAGCQSAAPKTDALDQLIERTMNNITAAVSGPKPTPPTP